MSSELVEVEAERIDAGGALEAQTRGEIDIQIRTARAYPRSIKQFQQEALTMATLDEETAESMFYCLPRGGKTIEGPSVRLAEIVASTWGHIRTEARIVSMDDKFVTARGVCWDLQRNFAASVEVKRRITGKDGKRYNDDMIGTTSNAACSIALRNAVFKVIPFTYVKSIYQKAREVAVGTAETLVSRRDKMIAYFGKMGVQPAQIFAVLGIKGAEDIGLDQLAVLKGTATAIKDGDMTVDAAFSEKRPERGTVSLGDVKPGKVETHTEPGAAQKPAATKPKPQMPKAASKPKPEPQPEPEPEPETEEVGEEAPPESDENLRTDRQAHIKQLLESKDLIELRKGVDEVAGYLDSTGVEVALDAANFGTIQSIVEGGSITEIKRFLTAALKVLP